MTEFLPKTISIRADELANAEDVAHLILRLSYIGACNLAEAISADVDKMVDGARDLLTVEAPNG